MMPRHNCETCKSLIPVALFLCWSCLQRVPQELRKAVDAARARMSFGYSAPVLAEYRSTKAAAIDAARERRAAA